MCPLERQQEMLSLVIDICESDLTFEDFNEVSVFFKELINELRQMNYSEFRSEDYNKYRERAKKMVETRLVDKSHVVEEMANA